jgi:phosphoserine phosphatase
MIFDKSAWSHLVAMFCGDRLRRCLVFGICLLLFGAAQARPEPADLLDRLLDVREAILASGDSAGGTAADAAFITVWDFDGTILDGDCSEGLQRDGRMVYPGLAELSIEHGLSALYSNKGGFQAFWDDYTMLDERIGHWIAYPFILQMLNGARTDQLSDLAAQSFATLYRSHYFATSVNIIRGLQAAGIEVHIISASAERFVRGAAATLDLEPDRISGIRVIERDGLLTEQLIYPVTWADGKRQRLQDILQTRATQQPGKAVFVIGGFGNSYNTDGPFLAWIARQSLPAGKPVVVMINGGTSPEEYSGMFTEIELKTLVTPALD